MPDAYMLQPREPSMCGIYPASSFERRHAARREIPRLTLKIVAATTEKRALWADLCLCLCEWVCACVCVRLNNVTLFCCLICIFSTRFLAL